MLNEKILLVEDDEFLRDLYQNTLKKEGFTIDVAADGDEGFKKMQMGGWDLVLLDIVLPKIDGFQIIKKLKKELPKRPNKMVIFLTNLDSEEEIKDALVLGDGYIKKSEITPGDLVDKVKNYLGKI